MIVYIYMPLALASVKPRRAAAVDLNSEAQAERRPAGPGPRGPGGPAGAAGNMSRPSEAPAAAASGWHG